MNEEEALELEELIIEGTENIKDTALKEALRQFMKFHQDLKRRVCALELFTDEVVFQQRHVKDALKVKDHEIRELNERTAKLEGYVVGLQDVVTGMMTKIIKKDESITTALKLTTNAVLDLMAEKEEKEEIPFK